MHCNVAQILQIKRQQIVFIFAGAVFLFVCLTISYPYNLSLSMLKIINFTSELSAISLSSSPVSRIVGTEKSSALSGAIKESAKAALGAEIRGKPGVTGTFN